MVEKREVLESRRKTFLKRRLIIVFSVLGVFCLVIALLSLFQCTDLIIKVSEDVQSSPQPNEWAMFRRDLAHTGNAGDNITLPQGTLKWTFPTGGPIHSSPAVVDGTIYFGSRDGCIYALDAATGEKLWSFQTGSWVESSPAVVGGVVYCGSNDGNLYALDAKTGEKLWSHDMHLVVRSSPAVADGVVYVGCEDYKLYAVDAATGAELWHGDTGGTIYASPAIAKGIVIVGSVGNMFYSFNAKNGNARIQFDAKVPVYSSAAIKDGIAYFTGSWGFFIAMDITAKNWWEENKLREYWNTLYAYGLMPKPSPPSGFLWAILLKQNARAVSSPSIVGDYAYVGSGENLVSIDLKAQKVQWTFSTGDDVVSSPAVAGNVIYIGSQDKHFYAVDRATGVKLWDYATGDQITSSPAVDNGMVYVGSEDGKLYAFD
ncbi:MAG: PQQ-binding-like beta-propeller repeat protein [Dehalococcoidales bacterium]